MASVAPPAPAAAAAAAAPAAASKSTITAGQHGFNEHPQPRTFAPSKEDVLQNLQYFFGAPVSPEKLKDYSEHHAMTYHFPDAYAGQNTKIRDTLNNLILKSPQNWQTSVGLPFFQIEGTVVEWDEVRFDVRLMQRVPYEGQHALQHTCPHTCPHMAAMENYGEFRDVPNHPGLRVSSKGFIQQKSANNDYWWPIKKPAPHFQSGYRIVVHNHVHLRIGRVVALTFLGDPPSSDCTVDHIDQNRGNDCVENLRWATRSEQTANRSTYRPRCLREEVRDGEIFRKFDPNRSMSQFGRIHDTRGNKIYTPSPTKGSGYAKIVVNGSHIQCHNLVAKMWPELVDGCEEPGMTIDHKDRDSANNRADNLRWATKSEQRHNQNRPGNLYQSEAQRVNQIAIDIRPPKGEWQSCDSYMAATRILESKFDKVVSQSQIGQIIRKYPAGYVASKGVVTGWSFRKTGHTAEITPTIAKKRPQGKTAVEVKAPGSYAWMRYGSCLEASRSLLRDFSVSIHSGSIGRSVLAHPEGHTMQSKRNAGWTFRKAI